MRPSPRGFLGALSVTAVLGLTGCATAPRERPPAATALPAAAEDLVRRWEAERQAFPGLRAAVDLSVRRRGRTDRTAAVLLLSSTHLRLEVATPFGFPALVATVGPERITVFRPLDRKAWTARPTPDAVTRWLGTPLAPDLLIGLLAGRVPLPPDPTVVRVETASRPHLAFERGAARYRVWVTPQGRPGQLLVEDGERLTVDFEWTVSGDLQSVRAQVPARGAELTVRYISAEYVSPPPEAFELLLPADVELERID